MAADDPYLWLEEIESAQTVFVDSVVDELQAPGDAETARGRADCTGGALRPATVATCPPPRTFGFGRKIAGARVSVRVAGPPVRSRPRIGDDRLRSCEGNEGR